MKYDDLVKRLDQCAQNLIEVLGPQYSGEAGVYSEAAAAIRDLQQHVPPEGCWWTECTNKKGESAYLEEPLGTWGIMYADGSAELIKSYPTAAAAMAAIEGEK